MLYYMYMRVRRVPVYLRNEPGGTVNIAVPRSLHVFIREYASQSGYTVYGATKRILLLGLAQVKDWDTSELNMSLNMSKSA